MRNCAALVLNKTLGLSLAARDRDYVDCHFATRDVYYYSTAKRTGPKKRRKKFRFLNRRSLVLIKNAGRGMEILRIEMKANVSLL